MNRITRLIAVVFLVTFAIAALWGFLAVTSSAEETRFFGKSLVSPAPSTSSPAWA
ncbi:MAG: hypothetical protein ISS49_00660 [Anaerolineae bacterium]|nr:hypothetical protein [Anaerolineae bacterium]